MGIAVPRLSVHAESGDNESMGEVTSISIGYGLHQAWILTAIFGAPSSSAWQRQLPHGIITHRSSS